MLTIVGDSMGRPLVDAIEADPLRHDTTSVLMLGSGGSIMSADVKNRQFDGFPSAMVLTEAIGSTGSPAQAVSITVRGQGAGQALRFNADERTTVFDDESDLCVPDPETRAGWPRRAGCRSGAFTTPKGQQGAAPALCR